MPAGGGQSAVGDGEIAYLYLAPVRDVRTGKHPPTSGLARAEEATAGRRQLGQTAATG